MAKGFQLRSMCARSVPSVMSDSLQSYGPYPARIPCPWDSPGKNTGVGYHFLLQRIFLTQVSNLHLLHWQKDSLPMAPPGKHKEKHCLGNKDLVLLPKEAKKHL